MCITYINRYVLNVTINYIIYKVLKYKLAIEKTGLYSIATLPDPRYKWFFSDLKLLRKILNTLSCPKWTILDLWKMNWLLQLPK